MQENETVKTSSFSFKQAVGIIMFVVGFVIFLCLVSAGFIFGDIGKEMFAFVLGVFGYSAYAVFFLLTFWGIKLFANLSVSISIRKYLALLFALLFVILLFQNILTNNDFGLSAKEYLALCYERGLTGLATATAGGVVFGVLSFYLVSLATLIGSYIIVSTIILICLLSLFNWKKGKVDAFFSKSRLPKTQGFSSHDISRAKALVQNNPELKSSMQADKKLFVHDVNEFLPQEKQKKHNASFDILLGKKESFDEYTFLGGNIYQKKSDISKDIGNSLFSTEKTYTENYTENPNKPLKSMTREEKKKFLITPVENFDNYYLTKSIGDHLSKKENTESTNFYNNFAEAISQIDQQEVEEVDEAEKVESLQEEQKDNALSAEEFAKHQQELREKYKDYISNDPNTSSPIVTASDIVAQKQQSNSVQNQDYSQEKKDQQIDYQSPKTFDRKDYDEYDSYIAKEKEDEEEDFSDNFDDNFEQEYEQEKDEEVEQIKQELSEIQNFEEREKKRFEEAKFIYRPPFKELLNPPTFDANNVDEDFQRTAGLLEETLSNFKIEATVEKYVAGPTVTRYFLLMPVGITISRLLNIAKDIGSGIESTADVIISQVYGTKYIAVDVPNKKRHPVFLRDLIDDKAFLSNPSPAVFALGKETTGENVFCDIKKMPHLLVAGTTGSGKSVCITSIILSIIFKSSPEDIRLILIDPKMIDFVVFENLPHLLYPKIIGDVDGALNAFNWAIEEMMRRNKLLKEARVPNIDEYNKIADTKLVPIVIIVDEFATLIANKRREEMEQSIQRIVQLSRACGMYLVLATQRPSVDVVTGVIKANLPSRIAFRVNDYVNSKNILDTVGAEKLLGSGDLLYKDTSSLNMVRLQGPYIKPDEVRAVVDFVKDNNPAFFDEEIIARIEKKKETAEFSASMEENENFVEVLRFVVEQGEVSISGIQTRFGFGFPKAKRIFSEIEKMGYLGEPQGPNRLRPVLLTMEEFRRIYK